MIDPLTFIQVLNNKKINQLLAKITVLKLFLDQVLSASKYDIRIIIPL